MPRIRAGLFPVLLLLVFFGMAPAEANSIPLRHTLANPSPASTDNFGAIVAVDGSIVVIGAPNDNTGAGDAGSAYVYNLSGPTPLNPVLVLNNPAPAANDFFGYAVAVSGTRVVVGAYGDDNPGVADSGRAFVYDLAGPNPAVPILTLSNPAPTTDDSYGRRVAIDGNRVAIAAFADDAGAPNAGRVYVYDLGSSTPGTALTIGNPSPAAEEGFGVSVSLSGNKLAVGAWNVNDDDVIDSGRVYVYDLASATPTEIDETLPNPAPGEGDNFGYSVSISGNLVVAGCDNDDAEATNSGRAYAFDLSSPNPDSPVAILKNPNPGTDDQFGRIVAISGTRIVVGADRDGSTDSGFAFVFDLSASSSTKLVATLANPTPGNDYRFGYYVAVSARTVVCGAFQHDDAFDASGAAYVFAPLAPVVTTTPATAIGQTSAILNASVNANGDNAMVAFEYGLDDSYGTSAVATPALVAGSNATPVSATAIVLPGRVYHYRASATNNEGTTTSADATFTSDASPPSAVTGNAAQVTGTSASLVASVNPNSAPTQVYFEYGLTVAYGSSTPPTTIGSGSSLQDVIVPITGLNPDFTYHFRIVASNLKHTVRGVDQFFTTTVGSGGGGATAVPAISNISVADAGQTTASAQGQVNANGGETFIFVKYGPTTAYGQTTTPQGIGNGMSPANFSIPLTDLLSGTEYHYSVVASNGLGTTNSSDGTFNTLQPPPLATTGSATPGPTFATLTASVNPRGLATTAVFEYGPTAGLGSTIPVAGTLTGNTAQTVSVTLNGLAPGMPYSYRINASSAAGPATGDILSFNTLEGQAPIAVADVVYVTSQTATLNVVANDINVDTGETGTGLSFDGIESNGAHGAASGGPIISYDPNAAFPLTGDSFEYRIKTNANQTAIGAVKVLPFAALRGTYGGIITAGTNGTGSDGGSINPLELATNGAFTASLRWQGKPYVLRSTFDSAGNAALTKAKTGAPAGTDLVIALHLQPEGLILGELTDEQSAAKYSFILRKAGKASASTKAGVYTSFIDQPRAEFGANLVSLDGIEPRGIDESPREVIVPGDGFTVTKLSQLKNRVTGRYVGRVPDGEPFAYGSSVYGDALPLDVSLYPRKIKKKKVFHGFVAGDSSFSGEGTQESVLQWGKLFGSPGLYGNGFLNGLLLRGDLLYSDRASALGVMLSMLGEKVRLEFKGGDLSGVDPEAIMVADGTVKLQAGQVKVQITASDLPKLKVKVSPFTGTFSGSFTHPDPAITKPVRFQGILRKPTTPSGKGNFRGSSNAGSVRLFKQN